jgi:K+-transporting ATPase KdpF subunit
MMTLMLVASGPGHFEYIATAAIAVVVTGYLLYALLRAEEL